MVLLAVDITWTVTARGVVPHQGFWFLNNAVHLLAIGVCFCFHLKYEASSLPFYFAIGLLLTNGLIDFIWNRAFYFADRRHEQTVFLSAPFSQLLTDKGLPEEFRKRLEEIIQHLEAKGWSVGSAHEREAWGEKLDSPYKAVNADLQGIEDASALVAILNSPPSPGVQMEIGFALARGKKLVLVGSPNETMPYLIRGVKERESVVTVPDAEDIHELAAGISEALEALDQDGPRPRPPVSGGNAGAS
jgi:nucleoside 2-deoxyribosyltransferase